MGNRSRPRKSLHDYRTTFKDVQRTSPLQTLHTWNFIWRPGTWGLGIHVLDGLSVAFCYWHAFMSDADLEHWKLTLVRPVHDVTLYVALYVCSTTGLSHCMHKTCWHRVFAALLWGHGKYVYIVGEY